MNWTTEFPTKPGFYWIRNYQFKVDPFISKTPALVKVSDQSEFSSHGITFGFHGSDMDFPFTGMISAEWYGPIEPPE